MARQSKSLYRTAVALAARIVAYPIHLGSWKINLERHCCQSVLCSAFGNIHTTWSHSARSMRHHQSAIRDNRRPAINHPTCYPAAARYCHHTASKQGVLLVSEQGHQKIHMRIIIFLEIFDGAHALRGRSVPYW
jgi:hypothetical protein